MSVKIITEIASSHNGDPKIVDYLTRKHINSKSHYLKYQIFKSSNLINRKDKNFKKFKKIEINYEIWESLINKYKKKTNLILEAFDQESYYFCRKFKKDVDLKISTSEVDNFEIIEDALKNFKGKIFLNVSGYDFSFIKKIINNYFNTKNKKKLIILYGYQGFPSKPKDLRLRLFDYFKNQKITYGYSDHSHFGFSEDFLSLMPYVLKKKISYIEKHICKKISKSTPDYISSLNTRDFIKFVKIISKYNELKINTNLENSMAEKKYSKVMHKFAFAKRNIKSNETLNINDIIFLRTSMQKGLRREELDFRKKISSTKFIRNGTLLKKSNCIL